MTHPHDPTVQVVQDAFAFTTAAVDGDSPNALTIASSGLDTDHDGFLDALVSVIQVLADEAFDAGVDPRPALREVALGVHLAHLAELANDHDPSTEPRS